MDALEQDMKYTYEFILSRPEDERWELIDGVPYMMAQPTIEHERIHGSIFYQLYDFLRGKTCEVFNALGVRLSLDDRFVVPDITVICDKTKLADGKTCIGAPDMVVEILSPSTAGRDRLEKFNLYLDAKVNEYWIVDPETKIVSVNVLENGKYVNYAYGKTDTVAVNTLGGCKISLPDVFA